MTQKANDALTYTVSPPDNDNIHNTDLLIEPSIDTDDIKDTIDNDETLNRIEKKCESILTLNSNKQTETTSFCQKINRFAGIFYAFIGACLFTCSTFIIKQLRVDFFDVLFARFILEIFILTAYILYKKVKFINGSTNLIILQIIRSIIASSAFILFYTSYRYLPLPDLTTCRYTQVAWTTILAMIIFHERISIVSIFAIIFTLTGVVFVAQPTFLFNNHQILTNKTTNINFESDKSYRLFGLSLAIGCALLISLSMVLNKKLILSKIPQSIIMFEISFLNLCLIILKHIYNRFILHKYLNQTMFTRQFILASCVSLIHVFSNLLTQRAIRLEHPSIISVVQSFDIVFAIILQNLFAKEKSNWLVLIGSFLVITSIFLVGIHKFWKDRKKSSEKDKIIRN